MSDFDMDFEKKCEEYLNYLYATAGHKYGDMDDIDSLVQDTMMVYIIKSRRGDVIKYPKAFLASTLHHKYNDMLREKYHSQIVSCDVSESMAEDEVDDAELRSEEYASVRREIGRLICIYREVTIRYYVHGKSVEQIATELGISKGTVLSRLSSARGQIKEGLQAMEKYSEYSYAPKVVSIGVWGSYGLSGEPESLIRSPIESNILVLAYENPVSIRGLADTMGMPSAYIEPIVEALIKGELLGRTAGGLVYTRCYMQKYEDCFGNVPAQEALADKYAEKVWNIVWKHIAPLTERAEFAQMNEKQKATLVLFTIRQAIAKCIMNTKPSVESDPKSPPERPNGGRWLATATVYENGQRRDSIYESSGPVLVNYSADNDGNNTCQMFDFQSVFGDAHWAYAKMKYKLSMQTVLRFYASLLPCDAKPDNNMIYELIPDFEKLHILRRLENGEIALDIPALTFDEVKCWNQKIAEIRKELKDLLGDELKKLWSTQKNKAPKHIDYPEYYKYLDSSLMAYVTAQLLSIVKKGLLPYQIEIGKTPIIYIAYRKKQEE